MGALDILLIGIGLSMDAFAVSISKGLKMQKIDLKQGLVIALFFGGFQALMPMIGYGLSIQLSDYVDAYSHWIAFVLLTVIGGLMIREASNDEEENVHAGIQLGELFLLAISTSIDALAVGVSFGAIGSRLRLSLVASVTIIGIMTLVISLMGVVIGNLFGIKYKSRAEVVGGIILILIGVKLVLEHYL